MSIIYDITTFLKIQISLYKQVIITMNSWSYSLRNYDYI